MANTLELIEKVDEKSDRFLQSPKVDGPYISKLCEYEDETNSPEVTKSILSNVYKAPHYFISPQYKSDEPTLSKILCLGKVQSGKTVFFLACIAVAFDNGYDLAYIIGGTKLKLKNQNFERVRDEFANNPKVKVLDLSVTKDEEIADNLSKGYKVIAVLLKNPSENVNLGALKRLVELNPSVPSIVVDDEGDEYSPGAPKSKATNSRAGRTHDAISDIVYSLKICTYLSVTATPQANFLISTIDALSPDFAVLVEPGNGYIGGISFHDLMSNPHCVQIDDSDDFSSSVPDSFENALYFFILAACIKRAQGFDRHLSMLVHPSSFKVVQSMVVSKITDTLEGIRTILTNPKNVSYSAALEKLYQQFHEYCEMNQGSNTSFDDVREVIPFVISQVKAFEFNTSPSGYEAMAAEAEDKSPYKIYVGGNMLGRGLTIKNLIVTYIYRDSKVSAVDTLYQRARWFGYKASYFDICRVYMTHQLKQKFVTIVENENDMWHALNSFLLTKTDIKNFPRIFSLPDPDGKMVLTRRTVSNTVVVDRVNPGYSYDKTIWFAPGEIEENRDLYQSYFEAHKTLGHAESFSSSGAQVHFVVETTFTSFYEEFLSKYHFPRGSEFGLLGFRRLLEEIKEHKVEDNLAVVVMRYQTGEQRTPIAGEPPRSVKELPQGRDEGTGYSGDKVLSGYAERLHFQIHLVYINQDEPQSTIPLLAFNNPISSLSVRYVTGDNVYGSL